MVSVKYLIALYYTIFKHKLEIHLEKISPASDRYTSSYIILLILVLDISKITIVAKTLLKNKIYVPWISGT